MFTGIVEEKGRICESIGGTGKLKIEGNIIFSDLKIGDSVCTNGVCLTAERIEGKTFTADVMPETLRRSNLGALRAGSFVNLERAMSADGRFGGHIVSGHIDGMGRLISVRNEGNAALVTIGAPDELMRYIVQKGSVAIDGISLTVAALYSDAFVVSVIPHTLQSTALGDRKTGSAVNIECDIIGKYVEKLVGRKSGITREMLENF